MAWLLLVILAALSFLAARAAAASNVPLSSTGQADQADEPGGADADDSTSPEADDVAGDDAHEAIPEVVIAIPEAPPIAATIAAGYTAAGLDRDPTRGWVARARLAGLVPQVTVADGIDSTWHDIDPNIGRRQIFEVRATWRLDRLLFDTNELHVATIEASRRREKRRIANRVIHAYFIWRRATAAASRDARWTSHAEEAAAELDALTNGWFSTELTTRRHGLSERRTGGTRVSAP